MKIMKLKDDFRRTVYFARMRKRAMRLVKPIVPTRPVFIFGVQRSGTRMLTGLLQLHPQTEVYDERPDGEIYVRYRIRDMQTVHRVLQRSRAPITCFKAICDSHIIHDLLDEFPSARCLWITRHYADVANSRMRKFEHATRTIRTIGTGAEGGGWYREGLSIEAENTIRDVYSDALSDFDLSCLAWWGRNRIYIEHGLDRLPNLMSLQYEDVVTRPDIATEKISEFLEIPYEPATHRHLFESSIKKHEYPRLNATVKALCDELDTQISSKAQPLTAASNAS